MNPSPQEPPLEYKVVEAQTKSNAPTRATAKNTWPPLPADYQELCTLCRAGKLFDVQDWFKTRKYTEPQRYNVNQWPIGIAIEKGFHSLVEVLLKSGVPANERALQRAVRFRNKDIVELMFRFGADVKNIKFEDIISIGEPQIIRVFIEQGADLISGYPIAKGLIRQTRLFLGIYKSYIEKYPELQFQADMALRHFCEEGSLRGVSLLTWLSANPRAKVPLDAAESEEFWSTPLEAAGSTGKLDVIKRLKPDPAKDDINLLFKECAYRGSMDLVRYWISLGADINHVDAEGGTYHCRVLSNLSWAFNPRDSWMVSSSGTDCKRFTREWFSAGAKWLPKGNDIGEIRKALSRLPCVEAFEFIKLLVEKEVMPKDSLGEILDTPKLRQHLKDRRTAVAALVPRVQRWVKADRRERSFQQAKQASTRLRSKKPQSPPPAPERRVIWNDPRNVRRLSDE